MEDVDDHDVLMVILNQRIYQNEQDDNNYIRYLIECLFKKNSLEINEFENLHLLCSGNIVVCFGDNF